MRLLHLDAAVNPPSLQVPAGEGKVYKCLFNHKFEEAMSEKVKSKLFFVVR